MFYFKKYKLFFFVLYRKTFQWLPILHVKIKLLTISLMSWSCLLLRSTSCLSCLCSYYFNHTVLFTVFFKHSNHILTSDHLKHSHLPSEVFILMPLYFPLQQLSLCGMIFINMFFVLWFISHLLHQCVSFLRAETLYMFVCNSQCFRQCLAYAGSSLFIE